ncbi:hypothetical protein [Nocardia fluminea]|uniref:hypothetical protein n=1 Tax=Nocardia fluminea TaxID=134984 RepID=UPI0037923ACB
MVGAVVGGLLTGYLSGQAIDRQIHAADRQQAAEFSREQKQAAYSKFIIDSFASNQVIARYVSAFARNDDLNGPEFLKIQRDAYDAMAPVAADYRVIQLVAGTEIAELAKQAWVARGATVTATDVLYGRWWRHELSEQERHGSYRVDFLDEATRVLDTFTEKAHADIVGAG